MSGSSGRPVSDREPDKGVPRQAGARCTLRAQLPLLTYFDKFSMSGVVRHYQPLLENAVGYVISLG